MKKVLIAVTLFTLISCQEILDTAEGVGQIPRELGRHALDIEDVRDGQDGDNGSDGSDGIDGQRGQDGSNGLDGDDGEDADVSRIQDLEDLVNDLVEEVIRLEEAKADKKGKGKK